MYIRVYEHATSAAGNSNLLDEMVKKGVATANRNFDEHNKKMHDTGADDMIFLETTDIAEVRQFMDYLYV